jgi:tetratricopeptide (TPR) repeat protein
MPEILEKTKGFVKTHRFLLLMILVLFLVRNGMVLFDMWSVRDGGDLPESLINGNFAFDVLDGNWRGWGAYLGWAQGHIGNELLVSIIAMPLYLVFGSSLLVLSQVPIIYSAAIGLLLYYICKRWMNEAVAKIGLALFVCAPIEMQGWSLYPYCIHLESAFFSLLAVVLFFSLFESKVTGSRMLLSAGFGLVSGIGVFHSEIYFMTLGFLLILWFVRNRLFFIKAEFFVFLLFLAIGLVPYFYFGLDSIILSFKSLLLQGSFSPLRGTYIDEELMPGYLTTLRGMSVLFWPVKNIAFSLVSAWVVTLTGLAILGWYAIRSVKLLKEGNMVLFFFALYCACGIFITLIAKVTVLYYFYPLFAQICIVTAVFFDELRRRYFAGRRFSKVIFYSILFFCCFANVYGIARGFDLKTVAARFEKQLNINGCCYYWPWSYFAPGGFKTKVGAEVETIATKTYFTSHPIDESIRQKRIYITDTRSSGFVLSSVRSYMVFGKDVSFAGLEQLAEEIRKEVPEEAQLYAYKGLAVYYVNDNRLKVLLKDFRAGVIEKNIPGAFQSYFYKELSRKIYSRYHKDEAKSGAISNMFEDKQRAWMLETSFVYRDAPSLNPRAAFMHVNYGRDLFSEARFEEAINHFLLALKVCPDYTDAHKGLGIVFNETGRFDKAVERFNKVLSSEPDSPSIHDELGFALAHQGKLNQAAIHFKKVLQIDSENISVMNNLAVIFARQGKLDQAISHYLRALQIKPDYIEAHYNLARVLQAQGKLDEAARHYRKAIQIKPDFIKARNALGSMLTLQGKPVEAID